MKAHQQSLGRSSVSMLCKGKFYSLLLASFAQCYMRGVADKSAATCLCTLRNALESVTEPDLHMQLLWLCGLCLVSLGLWRLRRRRAGGGAKLTPRGGFLMLHAPPSW